MESIEPGNQRAKTAGRVAPGDQRLINTSDDSASTAMDQLFACLGYDWLWDRSGENQLILV